MRYLVLVLLSTMLVTGNIAAETDSGVLLQQAVETYQSALDTADRTRRVQLFGRAEALFARVIEQHRAGDPGRRLGADLYLNLGNAALGAEHLGPAIIAYRRALLIDPNHSRASQNLLHARTLLPDWVPTPSEDVALGSFFDWTRRLGRGDWYGLAAIAFLIAMLLIALFLRTGKSTARNLAVLFAVLWLGILARLFLDRSSQSPQLAVVIAAEVTAHSADSVNAPARFPDPLPGGSEVQIVERRDHWVRVRLFDSREAWLPASAIETL